MIISLCASYNVEQLAALGGLRCAHRGRRRQTATSVPERGGASAETCREDVPPLKLIEETVQGHKRCGIQARFLSLLDDSAAVLDDNGSITRTDPCCGSTSCVPLMRQLTLVLGRDAATCDVVIPFALAEGPLLSRRHCTLCLHPCGASMTACVLHVTDHDSLNGTFLDDARIPRGGSLSSTSFDPLVAIDVAEGREPVCTLSFGGGGRVRDGAALRGEQLKLRIHVYVRVLWERSTAGRQWWLRTMSCFPEKLERDEVRPRRGGSSGRSTAPRGALPPPETLATPISRGTTRVSVDATRDSLHYPLIRLPSSVSSTATAAQRIDNTMPDRFMLQKGTSNATRCRRRCSASLARVSSTDAVLQTILLHYGLVGGDPRTVRPSTLATNDGEFANGLHDRVRPCMSPKQEGEGQLKSAKATRSSNCDLERSSQTMATALSATVPTPPAPNPCAAAPVVAVESDLPPPGGSTAVQSTSYVAVEGTLVFLPSTPVEAKTSAVPSDSLPKSSEQLLLLPAATSTGVPSVALPSVGVALISMTQERDHEGSGRGAGPNAAREHAVVVPAREIPPRESTEEEPVLVQRSAPATRWVAEARPSLDPHPLWSPALATPVSVEAAALIHQLSASRAVCLTVRAAAAPSPQLASPPLSQLSLFQLSQPVADPLPRLSGLKGPGSALSADAHRQQPGGRVVVFRSTEDIIEVVCTPTASQAEHTPSQVTVRASASTTTSNEGPADNTAVPPPAANTTGRKATTSRAIGKKRRRPAPTAAETVACFMEELQGGTTPRQATSCRKLWLSDGAADGAARSFAATLRAGMALAVTTSSSQASGGSRDQKEDDDDSMDLGALLNLCTPAEVSSAWATDGHIRCDGDALTLSQPRAAEDVATEVRIRHAVLAARDAHHPLCQEAEDDPFNRRHPSECSATSTTLLSPRSTAGVFQWATAVPHEQTGGSLTEEETGPPLLPPPSSVGSDNPWVFIASQGPWGDVQSASATVEEGHDAPRFGSAFSPMEGVDAISGFAPRAASSSSRPEGHRCKR